MLVDLVQIERAGRARREENLRLRMHLKTRNFQEKRLKRIAAGIEEQIDCTVCANCCRKATVKLQPRDVARLARHLGLREEAFVRDYTELSSEEGLILKRTGAGCVFLEGTACSVYDARPRTCEHFPHLTSSEGSLVSRMWQLVDRACYCPIVYHTLEAWKDELGVPRRT